MLPISSKVSTKGTRLVMNSKLNLRLSPKFDNDSSYFVNIITAWPADGVNVS